MYEFENIDLRMTIEILKKQECIDIFLEILHNILKTKDYMCNDKMKKNSFYPYLSNFELFWLE